MSPDSYKNVYFKVSRSCVNVFERYICDTIHDRYSFLFCPSVRESVSTILLVLSRHQESWEDHVI